MESHVLPVKYIDIDDLKILLKQLFGTNFEVDSSGENHLITAPRKLSDDEVKSIMKG